MKKFINDVLHILLLQHKKLVFSLIFVVALSTAMITTFLPSERLNVVFNINDKYVYYTKLVINSIIRNNRSKSDYTFWILESDITAVNKADILDYVHSVGQEVVFVTIDQKYIEKWSKMDSYWPPIIMARLLIPDLLPQTIKKALYLDADILVAEDLKHLFDEDIKDYYVGMVEDARPEYHQLKEIKNGKYANSGVILFNLEKMRQDNMVQALFRYFDENYIKFSCNVKGSCYGCKDQDLINIVLHNGIKFMDKKWNNHSAFENVDLSNQKGIYHFASIEKKPWEHQDNSAQKLWLKYKEDAGL